MIYSELIKSAANIFEGDLRLDTHQLYEDKMAKEKYEDMKAAQSYNYRCWQIEQLGFHKFSITELIKLLYGSNHTSSTTSDEKLVYEYVYNHHTGKDEKNHWCHQAETYSYYKKYGLFHWPPCENRLIWQCRFCNLCGVKCEIPEGVMLKILRLQSLKLFNAFHVIDPIFPKVNPVFLGSVWELPPQFLGRNTAMYHKMGQAIHYFISDWC